MRGLSLGERLRRAAGTAFFVVMVSVPALPRTVSDVQLAQAEAAPADAPEARPQAAPKPVNRSQRPKKAIVATPRTLRPKAPPAAEPPPSLAAVAAAGATAAPLDIAARLKQAGAETCAATIDLAAVPSMVGVTQSNTISTWSDVPPLDKHAVTVFIGQRYGNSPTVPFGATGIIASPTPTGSCDATVIQVVASPLPCANVRDTLTANGKQVGILAGLPVVQQGKGYTLLMQTATNTCVLIGFRSTFGK